MKELLGFLVSILFFIFGVFADDQVRIIQPLSLVQQFASTDGLVPERPALFGVPPFGRTITGLLVWATPGDLDGCQPLNKSLNPKWPPSNNGSPLIVMVDRGDCTFVTKVRNAQVAGAQAVIVVDNVDESNLPYMADDGTGGDILIPSVLIYKSDGQKIKTADADPSVTTLVSMTWDIPSPDDRVEWTMWTSSNDDQSAVFKSVFGTAVRALNTSAQYTPHYLILNGALSGCTAAGFPCGTLCTNQGRYCATDPEHDTSRGLDGADIVVENLRQICIFQEVNNTNVSAKWWDYVTAFQTNCAGSKATWTQACSFQILVTLGVNTDNVLSCVTLSGGADTNGGPNTLLDAEMQKVVEDGVFYLPTVIINNAAYRGSMSCPTPISYTSCGVLGAICSGYPPDKLPCPCNPVNSSPGCDLCVQRDECGQCGGTGKVDVCGLCLPQNNSQYNKSCAGCDGVPNSGKKVDACNQCGGTGSLDQCGRCLQQGDPLRVDQGGYDACGVCLSYSDPRYNQTCAGCDGVPNSQVKRDDCGVCGGNKTKDQCGSGLSVGAIVAIALSSFAVVGLLVFFFLKRQQAKMRDDIDALLAQYQPLDGAARPQHNQPPPQQGGGGRGGTAGDDTDSHALIATGPVSDL